MDRLKTINNRRCRSPSPSRGNSRRILRHPQLCGTAKNNTQVCLLNAIHNQQHLNAEYNNRKEYVEDKLIFLRPGKLSGNTKGHHWCR